MGEAFDKEYGRMSGNLGLEAPQRAGRAAEPDSVSLREPAQRGD